MSDQGKPMAGDVSALLMAMIDGELGPADDARARAVMASDPRFAAEAEVYRSVGRNLAKPFERFLTQPVPVQILHAAQMTGLVDRLAPLPRTRRAPSWFSGWRLAAGGLAAAAVAISVGVLMMPGGRSQPALNVAVVEGLATAVSGGDHDIATSAGALKFKVVQTFRDNSGAICREYEAQAPAAGRDYGIACLVNGTWTSKALLNGDPAKNNSYGTAGKPMNDRLDELADQMRAGDRLSTEGEKALIASGWK